MNSNELIFKQGSFYNVVFGQRTDNPVPTSQTKNKVLKKEFVSSLTDMLNKNQYNDWPYTEKLIVSVEIKGAKNYLERIDIDNVLKILFDVLKGKVFIDDKQIFSVMASKFITSDDKMSKQNGFFVGIRKLEQNQNNLCIPPLFYEIPNIEYGVELHDWRCVEI
jgi:Holliday junction resolvase RusA-like endonuclease